MDTELRIRLASAGDLEALVHLAAAFRGHLQQSMPSDADFRASITFLLKDAGTEFFLACRPGERVLAMCSRVIAIARGPQH
jgi:hypothetical protein